MDFRRKIAGPPPDFAGPPSDIAGRSPEHRRILPDLHQTSPENPGSFHRRLRVRRRPPGTSHSCCCGFFAKHAASFIREDLPSSDRPSLIPKPKPMMRHGFSPKVLATHWGRNDSIWARIPSKLRQPDPKITWT
ncbi:hypothetical protein WN944_002100 [Citrus x changshan-huyou]|uniref:Uncharacterized protein n=1 Tax=Citrus x changshan-huyou TaxID=2935761 RepID=A0AAP0MKP8_9ROSI